MKVLALIHACFYAAVAVSSEGPGDSVVSAEPGDVVLLPCFSDGVADPSLTTWTGPGLGGAAGGEGVSPGARVSMLRDGRLILERVSAADAGFYFCNTSLAGNVTFHGRVLLRVTAGLNVSVSPASVLFNGTYVTSQGAGVTFNCSGSWHHSHHLTWSFRGSSSAGDVSLTNGSASWLDFTVADLKTEDQGVYTCSCRNGDSRTIRTSVEVLVYFVPDRHPECMWATVQDSSHVQFNCSWFGAYPTPTLQWQDGPIILASVEHESLSLTMNRSLLSSGQTLKCSGHHVALASERDAACLFTLEFPYPIGDPLTTAVEGTNVTLTCTESKSAPPANTVWRRGLQQEELPPGPKYVLSLEGPALTLTIVNVTKDDEGYYFCRSENPLGVQELEVYLTVKKNSAVTGAIVGVFIATLIAGLAVIIAKTVYSSRHRICLGGGFRQMEEDHGDVLSLVESDDDTIFQDSVPRLPPIANGSSTTLVQIHHIPSLSTPPRGQSTPGDASSPPDDHEEVDGSSPRQPDDTAATSEEEEPADLVTL